MASHLKIVKTSGGRYYIADNGGEPIPYPIIMNVIPRWAWNHHGPRDSWKESAWDRFYVERGAIQGINPLELWIRDQGRMLIEAGVNATGQYVDPILWANVPGLAFAVHPICIGKHVVEEIMYRGGDAAACMEVLKQRTEQFVAQIARYGVDPEDMKAVTGWSELTWQFRSDKNHPHGLLSADDALALSQEVYPQTNQYLREVFPKALIQGPRIAGSLRKDREGWNWVGRYDNERNERHPNDPTSHYWKLVKAAGTGADAYAQNNYADPDNVEAAFKMDRVSAALESWELSGATVISEYQHAVLSPMDNFGRWLSYKISPKPGFTYPVSGNEEDALSDHGRTLEIHVNSKSTVASGPYGWVDHHAISRYPFGAPWRGVCDPFRSQEDPRGGVSEWRSANWLLGFRRHVDRVRARHLELIQIGS